MMVSDLNAYYDTQEELKQAIETNKYPEFCEVMSIETIDTEWSDEHPLNKTVTPIEEFNKFFVRSFISLEKVAENKRFCLFLGNKAIILRMS